MSENWISMNPFNLWAPLNRVSEHEPENYLFFEVLE